MRRLLVVAVLGVAASAGAARADGIPQWTPRAERLDHGWGPHASSVTWPSVYPPGWYTNTYNHRWYFPWYAYYNFAQGPYANWVVGGGYAGYAYHGPAGYFYYPNVQVAQPHTGEWSAGTGGAFNTLQGLGLGPHPHHPPRELKEGKTEEKKDDKK